MYHEHWGMTESPYRDGLDRRTFQNTPVHDEALARMHFLLENQRRLGLLAGSPGAGKSLLLDVFAAATRRQGDAVAKLDLIGIDPREFCWQVCSAWQTSVQLADSRFVLWRRLTDRIQEFRAVGRKGILLLDNADEAGEEVLQQVVRLLQCDPSAHSPITAIIAARSERLGRLGDRLLSLASLRIDVAPLEIDETRQFVEETLASAGRRERTFDEQALREIHELSGGNPRRIHQLADLALIAGAGDQLQTIDCQTVQAAHAELAIH